MMAMPAFHQYKYGQYRVVYGGMMCVVYPAGVTGDWAGGLTDQTATGMAALTDNILNSTNDVQTVTYTFTPHIMPGDGGTECQNGIPNSSKYS